MNRGIAKRAVFETRSDFEAFLELLGRVSDDGLLEVHAYCLMTTHLHLLVRSPQGRLADAMQFVFLQYVRTFNRARKRDGSLFRGRYRARRIDDGVYWENTLRYIDRNPVDAGICEVPQDYPFGSASAYVHGGGPSWLARDAVLTAMGVPSAGADIVTPGHYASFMQSASAAVVSGLVRDRLETARGTASTALTDLIRSASTRQRRWFDWKARLADGTRSGQLLVPASTIDRLMARAATVLATGRRRSAARDVRQLHGSLLRDLAGAGYPHVAERLGMSASTAHADRRRHDARAMHDPRYRRTYARLVDAAIRRAYGTTP